MGLWNWITGMFDRHDRIADAHSPTHTDINPATGLPMVSGIGGIDVAGNFWGMNHSDWRANGHIHKDCVMGGSLENGSRI